MTTGGDLDRVMSIADLDRTRANLRKELQLAVVLVDDVYEIILDHDDRPIRWNQLTDVGDYLRLTRKQFIDLSTDLEHLNFSLVDDLEGFRCRQFENGDNIVTADRWVEGDRPQKFGENINDEPDKDQVFVYESFFHLERPHCQQIILITFQLAIDDDRKAMDFDHRDSFRNLIWDFLYDISNRYIRCMAVLLKIVKLAMYPIIYGENFDDLHYQWLNPKLQVFKVSTKMDILRSKMQHIQQLETQLQHEKEKIIQWLNYPHIKQFNDCKQLLLFSECNN